MKLRINPSSIRIRLSKSDRESLSQYRSVSDVLVFPGGEKLVYSLQIAESYGVAIDGQVIDVTIPTRETSEWLTSEKLTLEAKLPREGMRDLILLVEKDLHDL